MGDVRLSIEAGGTRRGTPTLTRELELGLQTSSQLLLRQAEWLHLHHHHSKSQFSQQRATFQPVEVVVGLIGRRFRLSFTSFFHLRRSHHWDSYLLAKAYSLVYCRSDTAT